jgi:SAM-dependent methyltransferase
MKGSSMNLSDVLNRNPFPAPWSEGDKIPWNEPGFSKRMLREHLSQQHDAASRRFAVIDRHCAWIHAHVLGGRPARVLDLGCGPGLYAQRLAHLGHAITGLDFSPASIEYAREQVEGAGLDCRFELIDLRSADFGNGFDLVMLIYGEINAFQPSDARRILEKAHAALLPGGRLVLEVHTLDSLREQGQQAPTWFSAKSGLFSEQPHLCLSESFWHEEQAVAINRYYIIDAQSHDVEQMEECLKAYSEAQYRSLLAECGFVEITRYPGLAGEDGPCQESMFVMTAQRAG